MGASTTLTVDAVNETVSIAPGAIAIHERVAVRIVGAVVADPADLELGVLFRTGEKAACRAFTADGADYIGTLDLSDARLVAMFADANGRETRQFDLALYDNGAEELLVNAAISIMNNPYTPGMALPTEG